MTAQAAERGHNGFASPRRTFATLWHPWDFIEAPTPTPSSQQHPSWKRISAYYLSPGLLLSRWESLETLIGVSFTDRTKYGLIDVDRHSPHHPDNDGVGIEPILAALALIGLIRVLIVRSSHSGGIHIYFPLPEPVSTWKLANLLANTFQDAGLTLKSGHLETFPNVKTWLPAGQGFSHYNAHRLPLQQGSVLLNHDLIPEGADLNRFMAQWQWCAEGQDSDLLTKALSKAKPRHRSPGPRGSALEFLEALESSIREGWFGRSQTNDLLSRIARLGYIFRYLTGPALVQYMVETAKSLPGYGVFCGHQQELEKRCKDWARAIEKSPKYYPYRSKKKGQSSDKVRKGPTNEEKRAITMARLNATMKQLARDGLLEPQPKKRAAQLVALGFSSSTLYKDVYMPLWHPKQCQWSEPPEPVSDAAISEEFLPSPENRESPENQEGSHPSLRSVGQPEARKEINQTPKRGVAGGSERPESQPENPKSDPKAMLLAQLVVLAGGRGRETFAKLLERTSLEKAKLAIASFQEQASRNAIANPLAFLASALRQGWVPNLPESSKRSTSRSQQPVPPRPRPESVSQPDPPVDDGPRTRMPDWFKEQLQQLQDSPQSHKPQPGY